MKTGEIIHGFEFISSRPIPELSGVLHEAVYKKNGAKLIFIDREDTNKTFAIAFKTIPEDDTGVFHIIEHSVLCGSDKYPVKEPFVELLKGSVKTFLNAFTFPDKTMYPVSSRNDKDFLNLIDVYMDAVLHPIAVTKPEIFYQEGWHYELHDAADELLYKGVVFNEMKGAYSSADEIEMEEMSALLYKGSCYGKDSGGNPTAIPSLTYDDFVASHKKYYHPSNSRIILDGSVDLDKTLALLDGFLCEYDYLEVNSDIPRVPPMGHTEHTMHYEISSGESPEGKARVCLGFAAGDFTERRIISALGIITDAIAGSNEAPFKKAMLDSGLCEDASFISYDGIQQNSVIIEIKNVAEDKLECARKLALDTIGKICEQGIDKKALTAALNSMEFRVREQDMATFPSGISYAMTALDTWLYGGDPIAALSFEEDIAFLRAAIDTDYYEQLAARIFLASEHSATLYMLPSCTLGEERANAERAKLARAKSGMSDTEITELIEKTAALEAWQQSSDTPEVLATLPKLEISDISDTPEKYPTEEYTWDGVPALYTKAASRGITYTNLLFDLSDFSEEELFYVSLLTDLFKNVPTEKTDAVALQTKIKTELGVFSTSVIVATGNKLTAPYFQVSVSALDSKLTSARDIIREVLCSSVFSDKTAIGKIVKQIKTGNAEAIAASGHSVAFARSAAYVSAESAVCECIDGIEFYLRIKELDANYAARADELCDVLAKTAERIFTRSRLTVCHAGVRNDSYMSELIAIFPDGEKISHGTAIKPLGVRKEGIVIPAAISYAALAGNACDYTDRVHGSLGVVKTILSYGYLWNVIRVQGGAYGAGFIKRASGTCGFYTYRDPDANRSADCFAESAHYLRELAASGEDITTFIIGAVGDADPLITPKVLSALAIGAYLRSESYEDRLTARREMLSTSAEDLLSAAELVERINRDGGICVVGGRDKLDACGKKLDRLIEI